VYPLSPFSHSRGSFETPVDPPSTEPDDAPYYTVTFNQSWCPYITGALKQLLLQSTWNAVEGIPIELTQQRVFNLIDRFTCGAMQNLSCEDFSLYNSDGGLTGLTPPGTGSVTPYTPVHGWGHVDYVDTGYNAAAFVGWEFSGINVREIDCWFNVGTGVGVGNDGIAEIAVTVGSGSPEVIVHEEPDTDGIWHLRWDGIRDNVGLITFYAKWNTPGFLYQPFVYLTEVKECHEVA
jgi:hypothetical protein